MAKQHQFPSNFRIFQIRNIQPSPVIHEANLSLVVGSHCTWVCGFIEAEWFNSSNKQDEHLVAHLPPTKRRQVYWILFGLLAICLGDIYIYIHIQFVYIYTYKTDTIPLMHVYIYINCIHISTRQYMSISYIT